MEHYFYNLSKGADVFNSLNELNTHYDSTSFLISAVGDLSRVSFKCPLNHNPIIFEKKLEIISLSGFLRSTESHLHVSVSDENCNVYGGHLLSGTIVLKSLDVLIGVLPNLNNKLSPPSNHNPINVEIYVLPNCPWSKRALQLLDSFNIKYNTYEITNDEDFQYIKSKTFSSIFPQIFINEKFIGGYTELSNLSSKGDFFSLIN